MKYPPFSVAVSVYKNDNPAFFDRALESITDQQTIIPNEIVLVVDGPVSIETDVVIDKYSKKYNLKVIRLETNGGLGNALKIATENCSYGIIARMDSDDVAVFNRFEQELCFISSHPNVDIVGGDISEFIDSEGNIIGYRLMPVNDHDLKKYLKKRCPFNHMTVMFKKESVLKCGGYLDWHYNEDYYLWIRMALNGCVFANTATVLVNVRTGKDLFARRGGYKYFKSEKKLQQFMLKNKIINYLTYLSNVFKRFVVQIILPNRVRSKIYFKFARSNNNRNLKIPK